MWRPSVILLIALCLPEVAHAAPVVTTLVGLLGPGGTVATWFAGLGTLGQSLVQLGLSTLLSLAAQALTPRPSQKRQLSIPTSRPPKRFIYGRFRTYGTPAPWRVNGRVLYGCIILNSRPSAGGDIRIWMDKRRCRDSRATGGADFTNHIYDFSGPGAILDIIDDFRGFGLGDMTNPRVWIGRGDQTGPPEAIIRDTFTANTFFQDSDAWRGLTVMWLRLDFGPAKYGQSRWRATPPDIEVEMDWSKVYDPRDEAQDPDDESTWTYSNNQALVLLDALRRNPIRQYPMRQIMLDTFVEAANIADQEVDLYHASVADDLWDDPETRLTEPRYTANGLLVWAAGELADQVAPIAQAGAGELLRAGGRIGYASGAYRAPLVTITDIVESGGINYQVLRPGRDLPRFVKGVYVSPARDWQEAELTPIEVEGATGGVGDDGILELPLMFVTSPTQAMRVQQIVARQIARQKTLSVTLWPEASNLVPGATAALNLPAPFSRVNGEWFTLSANPALWVSDIESDNMHMIVPATFRQNAATIYTWVPETDEQEVENEGFDSSRDGVGDVTGLVVRTGDGVSSPTQARLLVEFDEVDNADYYTIEVSRRTDDPADDPWVVALTTESPTSNLIDVIVGQVYDVRVVAVREVTTPGTGAVTIQRSEPALVQGILARFGTEAAAVPLSVTIAGAPIASIP